MVARIWTKQPLSPLIHHRFWDQRSFLCYQEHPLHCPRPLFSRTLETQLADKQTQTNERTKQTSSRQPVTQIATFHPGADLSTTTKTIIWPPASPGSGEPEECNRLETVPRIRLLRSPKQPKTIRMMIVQWNGRETAKLNQLETRIDELLKKGTRKTKPTLKEPGHFKLAKKKQQK